MIIWMLIWHIDYKYEIRDFYSSKDDLLEGYEEAKELIDLLEESGYHYDSEQNRYVK